MVIHYACMLSIVVDKRSYASVDNHMQFPAILHIDENNICM